MIQPSELASVDQLRGLLGVDHVSSGMSIDTWFTPAAGSSSSEPFEASKSSASGTSSEEECLILRNSSHAALTLVERSDNAALDAAMISSSLRTSQIAKNYSESEVARANSYIYWECLETSQCKMHVQFRNCKGDGLGYMHANKMRPWVRAAYYASLCHGKRQYCYPSKY